MFDFRINGFDILPDFIGYLLIFLGLSALVNLNEKFNKAKTLALPLIIISVLDIYQSPVPLNIGLMEPKTMIISLIGIISIILNILMIYNICIGIEEKAKESGNFVLGTLARSRWNLYLIFQIIFLVIFVFNSILKLTSPLLVLPLFLFSVIVYIMMLNLISQAEKQIH